MDEALIMEVWDTFKEYIPEKNKEMAATQYVDFLLGKDVESSIIEGLVGYDSSLDEAIKNALAEEGLDEDDEEDLDYYEDEGY
jgi:beta-lactam-binding protein with PASTA domain